MAVFHQVFKFDLARFKKRAFSAAYCLENRWYDRFQIFCRVQTWNWGFIRPQMIIISHFNNVLALHFFMFWRSSSKIFMFFYVRSGKSSENACAFWVGFWTELANTAEWASQGHSRTLENTARGRKKVHEVQTNQVKLNSKPPGIAQTNPQEKFP